MRITRLKIAAFCFCLVLAACAPPSIEGPKETLPDLQERLRALPGAVVSEDGLTISYPDDNLFAEGAVLPLPGGMEVLTPLIDLFLEADLQGSATVRSTGHDAAYDQRLAEKRLDLLSRIFNNRGVAERLPLQLAADEGPAFEVRLGVGNP
ncbi:MAG: hypothetical protein C0615_02625 [Desulfuromonas sp.]|nr:MAG: hypothetical protein C0615_02625 [Desulfuromonas sp.]